MQNAVSRNLKKYLMKYEYGTIFFKTDTITKKRRHECTIHIQKYDVLG